MGRRAPHAGAAAAGQSHAPPFCAPLFLLPLFLLSSFLLLQIWRGGEEWWGSIRPLDKDDDYKRGGVNWNLSRRSRPLRFEPVGIRLEHFVALSAYRSGRNSFAVIGESSTLALKAYGEPAEFCIFEKIRQTVVDANTGSEFEMRINTSAKVVQPGDSHDKPYETVIIECDFDKYETVNEGRLFLYKNGQKEMFVFHEKGLNDSILNQDVKYEVAFCCPSFHGHAFNSDVFSTWLKYHDKVVNVGHYFFYDHGHLTKRMEEILMDYIVKGKASLSKFEDSQNYESWYFHQVTSANDCLYRTRFVSRWTFFIDFDEFIFLPNMLSGGLSKVLSMAQNVPWISLGSVIWRIDKCVPRTKNESLLESMTWRAPGAYCRIPGLEFDSTGLDCLESFGYRKFLVNPLKVKSVRVHSPAHFEGQPLNWNSAPNSTDPKLYHFRGVFTRRRMLCRVKVNQSQSSVQAETTQSSDEQDVYDTTFAKTLQSLHSLGQ